MTPDYHSIIFCSAHSASSIVSSWSRSSQTPYYRTGFFVVRTDQGWTACRTLMVHRGSPARDWAWLPSCSVIGGAHMLYRRRCGSGGRKEMVGGKTSWRAAGVDRGRICSNCGSSILTASNSVVLRAWQKFPADRECGGYYWRETSCRSVEGYYFHIMTILWAWDIRPQLSVNFHGPPRLDLNPFSCIYHLKVIKYSYFFTTSITLRQLHTPTSLLYLLS